MPLHDASEAPELLPCPFCGSEAAYAFHHNENESGWENDIDHWVYCGGSDCLASVGMGETKKEVFEIWNTRAAPKVEPLVGAIKQAERALEPFSDRVYNDNGDCTVTDTHLCGYEQFTDAHFAYKAIRAALKGETNDT